jgi:hypothetical protein
MISAHRYFYGFRRQIRAFERIGKSGSLQPQGIKAALIMSHHG